MVANNNSRRARNRISSRLKRTTKKPATAKKQPPAPLVRPVNRARTKALSTERVIQSEDESFRKRLMSIENGFHLLDEQLDAIEAKLLIEPLLSAENENLPKKAK